MHYRKHIRLANYDYSQNGYYFVTICAAYMRQSKLCSYNCMRQSKLCGYNLERYKDMLKQELLNLEKRFSGVKLDFNEIMPTHIHFILYFEEAHAALPQVIQAYKSITTLKAKHEAKQALQLQFMEVAAELALPKQQQRLWQPNYYEHVIRNESALNKIREYIMNNPEKETYDWDKLDA